MALPLAACPTWVSLVGIALLVVVFLAVWMSVGLYYATTDPQNSSFERDKARHAFARSRQALTVSVAALLSWIAFAGFLTHTGTEADADSTQTHEVE